MKHIISVTVENKFGVLARVSGLFSSRGYNIDSLTVGVTTDPDISRMTIVVRGGRPDRGSGNETVGQAHRCHRST